MSKQELIFSPFLKSVHLDNYFKIFCHIEEAQKRGIIFSSILKEHHIKRKKWPKMMSEYLKNENQILSNRSIQEKDDLHQKPHKLPNKWQLHSVNHYKNDTLDLTQNINFKKLKTMDTVINGINLENWAAAAAHLAQGMDEEEICQVLGIELPVWQDTNEQWAAKLGDLMAEDMNIATTYGNIFANPKVGKFANAGTTTPTIDDLLQRVPDYDTYQKIFYQQSIAAQHGINAVTVLEENGLNLQTWGQLNMHYMQWNNEYMDSSLSETNPEEYKRRYDESKEIREKWEKHWTEFYKDNAVDLSNDIDF